jgi:hypothetical protein
MAVVEFAPYQKIPTEKKKVDARMGTIEKDEDYLSFLESLGGKGSLPNENAEAATPEILSTYLCIYSTILIISSHAYSRSDSTPTPTQNNTSSRGTQSAKGEGEGGCGGADDCAEGAPGCSRSCAICISWQRCYFGRRKEGWREERCKKWKGRGAGTRRRGTEQEGWEES